MKTQATETYKGYKIEAKNYNRQDGETFQYFNVERLDGRRSKTADTLEKAKAVIDAQPENLDPKNFGFANMHGWSDVNAYEIVRVVSSKTIVLRRMTATKLPFEMDFHPGGFLGHVSNQNEQKHTYAQNPEAGEIRAHRRKDGYFWSAYGRHILSTTPHEFYDYNF